MPGGPGIEHVQCAVLIRGNCSGLDEVGDDVFGLATLPINLNELAGTEAEEFAGRTTGQLAGPGQRKFFRDLPGRAVHHFEPGRRERINRRFTAEVAHGGDAIDPAPPQIECLAAAIIAHAAGMMVFRGPLFNHPQADGLGRNLLAEINIAVHEARPRVVVFVRLIIVAQWLFISGDLPPAVCRLDVHGTGAFEDINQSPLAVNFLNGQPAHRLRLRPFERVDAGINFRNWLGARGIPFALRVDLSRTHPHRGGGQQGLKPSAQQFHAFERHLPRFAGGGFRRAAQFLVGVVVHQHVIKFVGAFAEREPHSPRGGVFRQRNHAPPTVVPRRRHSLPNTGPLGFVERIGDAWTAGLAH